MFERRLKICLGILLSVMSILLLRAFHLQVITRASWVQQAEDFKKKAHYPETTRGRILDVKGHELAVDEACMDACVDYRAIIRDERWIRAVAAMRAAEETETWAKADRKQRTALIDQAAVRVKADIDRMFDTLAKETGQPPDQIEETCRRIDLRVAMSRRIRQYQRFREAQSDHEEEGDASWYRRWLIEGGKDGPQVDDYEMTEGEEVGVHPIVRNITPDAYMRLGRRLPECPGLSLRPGTHRKYPFGKAACHLLGTISTVNKEDLDADPNLGVDPLRSYRFNDIIGRAGLESLCEPTLRGSRGKSYQRDGGEDEIVFAPVPGTDVKTTIDIHLQDQIQKLFEQMEVPSNKHDDKRHFTVAMLGAAVVIDVKSGAVRALASYPDYDINTLSEDYAKLATMTEEAPLLNRATQSQLYPGSTVKPIVGIGAISQGLPLGSHAHLTVQSGIECTGHLMINGHKMPNGRCWVASKFSAFLGGKVAHHPVPADAPHKGVYGNRDGFLCFADALERSCNVYFETLGASFGSEGLSYWFEQFGLGRETGLGIAEAAGFLPRQLDRHQLSDAYFSAIGQVGVRATPIQMANLAATIARDGVWVRPRLVEDGYTLNPVKPRGGEQIPDRVELKVSEEALAAARDGMVRVVNSRAGTGHYARMSEIVVAGKTGTAQEGARIMDPVRDDFGNLVYDEEKDGKRKVKKMPRIPASADRTTTTPWYRGWGEQGEDLNHAWFIGFAPAQDPQVAFAVMVQYGGGGGQTAGQTAKKILTACIEHGYVKPAHR